MFGVFKRAVKAGAKEVAADFITAVARAKPAILAQYGG